MKKLSCFVASPAIVSSFASAFIASCILLASPASAQPAGDAANASRGSAAMYCWKDKLQVTGATFLCNWADSADEACKGNPMNDISKDAVYAEPAAAKRCNNGQWLVQVTKK